MTRWYLSYLTVLLCCAISIGAEVNFTGEPPSNRKAVERLAEQGEAGADSLKTVLLNEGYLDAEVSVEQGEYLVDAGKQSRIETIIWSGDVVDTVDVDVVFSREEVERFIEGKLDSYRSEGYFYVSAIVSRVLRRGDKVTIEAKINPGPLLVFNGVTYKGLVRTRPEMVDRYLLLPEGKPLTDGNLRALERAASSIPFLEFKPPPRILPEPGYTGAEVELVFEEKRQAFFSGGAGYVPDNATSFVWDVNLRFENLFGGGRRIDIKSERREEDRQILDIGYNQPLFVMGVGEFDFKVATRDYRDRFYEFALSSGYTARLSTEFSAGLSLGWRSVEPSNNLPSYSSFSSAFTIERDNIDNKLNPSSGLGISWTVSYSHRRYSEDSLLEVGQRTSFNETRNRIGLGAYQKISRYLVGHATVGYVGLETSEPLPPLAELYYIGGPGTIRGYRNEQFAAIRSAYATLEPRLRFNSGYLFIFYEGAYVNNRVAASDGSIRTDEFYRSSYGVGGAVIEGSRSVRISLGWNPEASFDQPRLSLEFSSEI